MALTDKEGLELHPGDLVQAELAGKAFGPYRIISLVPDPGEDGINCARLETLDGEEIETFLRLEKLRKVAPSSSSEAEPGVVAPETHSTGIEPPVEEACDPAAQPDGAGASPALGTTHELVQASDQDGYDGGWIIAGPGPDYHSDDPWECVRKFIEDDDS